MDQADFLQISQPRPIRTRREAIYAQFDGICHWCGRKTIYTRPTVSDTLCATVDHVIPRWRGGGNGKENLVLACNACNQRRNKEDHLGLEEGSLLRQPIPVVAKPKKMSKPGGHVALTADEKALLMARMEAGDRKKLEAALNHLTERNSRLEKELEVVLLKNGTIESELHLTRIELSYHRKAIIQMQSDWDDLTIIKFIRLRLWSKKRRGSW